MKAVHCSLIRIDDVLFVIALQCIFKVGNHCIDARGPMRIIVGMPNHSIEDPMVIGKILSHL